VRVSEMRDSGMRLRVESQLDQRVCSIEGKFR
jgi:hypothetical protein